MVPESGLSAQLFTNDTWSINETMIAGPDGLAVGPDGTVYVSDAFGHILKIERTWRFNGAPKVEKVADVVDGNMTNKPVIQFEWPGGAEPASTNLIAISESLARMRFTHNIWTKKPTDRLAAFFLLKGADTNLHWFSASGSVIWTSLTRLVADLDSGLRSKNPCRRIQGLALDEKSIHLYAAVPRIAGGSVVRVRVTNGLPGVEVVMRDIGRLPNDLIVYSNTLFVTEAGSRIWASGRVVCQDMSPTKGMAKSSRVAVEDLAFANGIAIVHPQGTDRPILAVVETRSKCVSFFRPTTERVSSDTTWVPCGKVVVGVWPDGLWANGADLFVADQRGRAVYQLSCSKAANDDVTGITRRVIGGHRSPAAVVVTDDALFTTEVLDSSAKWPFTRRVKWGVNVFSGAWSDNP